MAASLDIELQRFALPNDNYDVEELLKTSKQNLLRSIKEDEAQLADMVLHVDVGDNMMALSNRIRDSHMGYVNYLRELRAAVFRNHMFLKAVLVTDALRAAEMTVSNSNRKTLGLASLAVKRCNQLTSSANKHFKEWKPVEANLLRLRRLRKYDDCIGIRGKLYSIDDKYCSNIYSNLRDVVDSCKWELLKDIGNYIIIYIML